MALPPTPFDNWKDRSIIIIRLQKFVLTRRLTESTILRCERYMHREIFSSMDVPDLAPRCVSDFVWAADLGMHEQRVAKVFVRRAPDYYEIRIRLRDRPELLHEKLFSTARCLRTGISSKERERTDLFDFLVRELFNLSVRDSVFPCLWAITTSGKQIFRLQPCLLIVIKMVHTRACRFTGEWLENERHDPSNNRERKAAFSESSVGTIVRQRKG